MFNIIVHFAIFVMGYNLPNQPESTKSEIKSSNPGIDSVQENSNIAFKDSSTAIKQLRESTDRKGIVFYIKRPPIRSLLSKLK